MNKFALPVLLVGAAALSNAQLQSLTLQTESSASSGLNTVVRNAPRTYQAYYNQANFASAVTSATVLSGLSFRLAIGENWRPSGYVGSTWPDAGLNFSDFTIELSRASTAVRTDGEFISSTTTFSANMDAATRTQVRTGALTFAANSFTAGGGATGVHSYSAYIPFSTNYTLNPGEELVLSIRHSGYGTTGPLNAFFASGTYANNVADAVSSTTQGSTFDAAPNGFTAPLFVQFRTAPPVPEPASFAVLGLGAAALIRRHRKS